MHRSSAFLLVLVAACQPVEGPDAFSLRALDELSAVAWVERSPDGRVAEFVRGDLGEVEAFTRGTAEASLAPVLERVAPAFGVAPTSLSVIDVAIDELGHAHVKYQQRLHGLPVVGGELVVHVDASHRVYAVGGTAREALVPSVPNLSADEALFRAKAQEPSFEIDSPVLTYVQTSSTRALHLAWRMRAVGEREGLPADDLIFVDALDGRIVDRHGRIHYALSRRIHDGNQGTTLPGTLVRTEGQAAGNDAAVNAAYDNTGAVHDYYLKTFMRDSYDGQGATLVSTVHLGGQFRNNAFWNGQQMGYGDGDGQQFGNFARSLDVTAHELTHAVTTSTANLVYQNEPGALNEAMSDVLGAACEAYVRKAVTAETWLLGEDVMTPNQAGDALRYMDNPTRDGMSRDYYPERYTGTQDFGGVHLNSGIANLAFKLLVTGGTHPRNKTTVQVPAIGLEKAQQIFYRALTRYMTSNTNFAGGRTATANAANDLYGPDARRAVEMAWAAVGVGPVPMPTCSPTDSICDPGCNPVDPDCYCARDGQCTAQCQDLSKDPDCPKDCAKNGICAVEQCPVADTDCVALGETCSTEMQCKERRCVNDPQHPTTYCSKPCTGAADCPQDMECTTLGVCKFRQVPPVELGQRCVPGQSKCAGSAVCTGPVGGELLCRPACTDDSECNGLRCLTGGDGVRYCGEVARIKPSTPDAVSEGDDVIYGESCSASGGGLWAPLALAVLGPWRRRSGNDAAR